MAFILKRVIFATLAVSGSLNGFVTAKDGDGQVRGSGAPKSRGEIERNTHEELDPNPAHERHPPSHIGRDSHDQDETEDHGGRRSRDRKRRQGRNTRGGPDVESLHDEEGHRKPTAPDGRNTLPENRHRRNYKKGDGSKPSHAYDYLVDDLSDLREELVDTEETFGHASDETHGIQAKIRLLEQIRRNAKMLDGGMPQEEFDELVANLKRLAELRLEEHTKGPSSLAARRKQDEDGHPDDQDGYGGDHHDAEAEAKRKLRNKEMLALGTAVREAKDHWRSIPRPMTHNASLDQKKEIMEVYDQIAGTTDKAVRKQLRQKLEHLQTLIHDIRRHRDMSDEDRETVSKLRAESLAAETDEDRREIREEIELIFRDHRKAKRAEKQRTEGTAGGRGDDMIPRKDYVAEDEELQRLHTELHSVDSKDERKEIRKKIRERMRTVRKDDPDFRRDRFAHGPEAAGKMPQEGRDKPMRPGRHARPRTGGDVPPDGDQHPVGGENMRGEHTAE